MIDKNKTYRTRDDRYEVRIYATDGGKSGCEVHGAYNTVEFGWWPFTWDKNGRAYVQPSGHNLDLIEVKPRIKTTLWLNVYKGINGKLFGGAETTRELADSVAGPDRLDCIPIEIDVEDKS